MDLPHHGLFTCIHLTRKRYRCKDCNTTFFHPLGWVDDDHQATERFVNRIAALALERSFSDLSREYFEKMPDRDVVKAVSKDCTKRYKTLIRDLFPKATIVADKFHILKMADAAVDSVRKTIRSDIDSKRTQLKLKHDKYVLKTREHNLEDWQRERLDGWRELFPDIGIIYDLKEEHYRIYDAKTSQEAKERFNTWRNNIPPTQSSHWRDILITWGNWENEILAFFDCPITNAYTECQNGLTRAIDRLGRGYSFDAIRVKLLLAPKKQGVVTSYRSIRRKKKEDLTMKRYIYLATDVADDYETIRVPHRQIVTFGVDIAKLADWLDEDLTGQRRLPGIG